MINLTGLFLVDSMFLKMAACTQADKIRAVITAASGKRHDVMSMNSSEVWGVVAFLAEFTRYKKRELAFLSGLLLTDAAKWSTLHFISIFAC